MDVKLPKLGEGAESGSVVNILVAEGDRVEKGQTLLEVENEKAVAPIPATASGTVSGIRVKEGDAVSVGQVLLVLSSGDGAEGGGSAVEEETSGGAEAGAKSEAAAAQPTENRAATGRADEAAGGGVPMEIDETGPEPAAAPSIRKMARQLGIDLRRIRGSGSGGRIVLADVQAYVRHLQQLADTKGARPEAAATAKAESIDFSKWGPVKRERLSVLRKTISRRMSENWTSIPHVTQFDEADVTALMELRKKHASAYEEAGGHLTLTSFALKAAAAALKAHPVFNSSLDESTRELVLKDYYHLGVAVDTEHGLMVPVIRDVDRKSLLDLSREVSQLAEKARDRKLSLEEMQGGTFTISNQGGIGGGHFTPIVNRPEVAILGLGRGGRKAVVRDGAIEARVCLPLAISYDHRVIDGGTAARFTVDFVKALEGVGESDVALGKG